MLTDSWTVFWREARQNLAQFEDRRRLLLGLTATALTLVGLEIAFGVHQQLSNAHPVLLIWIWCWLPLGSAVTMATDTIAGERERHTLETLLSTRLPERAILNGKVLAIAVQSWLSAAGLALGVLVVLNAVTIWSGTLVGYPLGVVTAGSLISFLLTLLGTLTALLLSMNAPTVRQANLRVIVVTSILPVLLLIPVIVIIIMGTIFAAVAAETTGLRIDAVDRPSERALWAIAMFGSMFGLLAATAVVYGFTAMRFTRSRLMRTFAPDQPARYDAAPVPGPTRAASITEHPTLAYESAAPAALDFHGESPVVRILRDAAAVAWKEVVEARALVREWRGWLALAVVVILLMGLQMSAIASWFWSQGNQYSLMYWLAMAAVLPILVAQRSADAIAGERERHTGEILFTTRLSDAGILIGKLAVVALVPWTIALAIPALGLLTTNAFYASTGPFWYPVEVVAAGSTLTLGVAFLFASGGMLLSVGAPTVQQAARRISWFLMPILIAPGLAFRGSFLDATTGQDRDALREGIAGMVGSGEVMKMILLGSPLIVAANAALIALLWRRFARGKVTFD